MIHLSPSFWVQTTSKCSDKSSCFQTKAPREKLCFWDEDIAFLGHTGRYSITNSWSCEHISPRLFFSPSLFLSLFLSHFLSLSLSLSLCSLLSSLCTQELIHKHCSPGALLTSRVYCFFVLYLFSYSLISIHSVKKNSTRTAVEVILNILWWNAPMFYHLWCQTNAALMRTSTNNPLFSSNCTTWLIHVHPTWSEENILVVLHIVPLDLQFRHVQRHVR